jgi:DNA-binding MarR family transcriptional regulator
MLHPEILKRHKVMFKDLDPLLHSQLRLAVVSILITAEEADFVYLREKTGSTAGNLSVQIDKLSEAGYIEVDKGYSGKRPKTTCRLTPQGRKAFEDYIEALKSYF